MGGVWKEVAGWSGGNCGRIGVGLQVEFQVDFWGGFSGEKAVGWREMKVGSWVRLGKQLGRVWWLEVGLACWKGKRKVCCRF